MHHDLAAAEVISERCLSSHAYLSHHCTCHVLPWRFSHTSHHAWLADRPSLPEFHTHELRLGENNASGHTLRPISAEDAAEANLRDGRAAAAADVAAMYLASGNERTG